MELKKLIKKLLWVFAGALVLTWMACWPPSISNIDQPDTTDANSGFEVDVTVENNFDDAGEIQHRIGISIPPEIMAMYYEGRDGAYRLTFGIQLPQGWAVTDSIAYTGTYEGTFVYSDSLSQSMAQNYYPPDSSYYWWVCETLETMDDISGTIYFTPVINTNNRHGNFFLDYHLGYWNGGYHLSCSASLDHNITCGLADTVYVTSSAATGPGSLKAAIDSVSGDGTILFDIPLPATIYPSEEIRVYKNVTIIGPENNTLTISGNGSVRVFHVTSGRTTFEHLMISDGLAYNGGAIYYSGPSQDHYLNNVFFIGNQANGGNGGAIFIQSGNLHLTGNHFFNNSSANVGGAIYNGYDGDTLSIEETSFNGNSAASGGALYIYANWAQIYDVALTGNSADQGGALLLDYCNGIMENTTISGNLANNEGGGIYLVNLSNGLMMKNVEIYNNTAGISGGGIYSYNANVSFNQNQRCDIYSNEAPIGSDLYGSNAYPVYLDRFTVCQPNEYFVYPEEGFEIDIWQSVCPMLDQDVYVSPDGSDANSGTSPSQAYKTIAHALKWTYGDSISPNTIHLAAGAYSPSSNGEFLPLYPHDHLNIQGAGAEATMLEQGIGDDHFLELNDDQAIHFSNLAFQTNNTSPSANYIYLNGSSLTLRDFEINGNGAGIIPAIECLSSILILENGAIHHCNSGLNITEASILECTDMEFTSNDYVGAVIINDSSTANFTGCLFENNHGSQFGAIRGSNGSHLNLSGTTIRNNHSEDKGGGIFFDASTAWFDPVNRCNIYMNSADFGNDLFIENISGTINVCLDTFSVMYPTHYHAYPLGGFGFDILHGKLPQVNQDLFVSPDGSDENSGLTADDPLRSLSRAVQMLMPGTDSVLTINLAAGTYSYDSTGENFPCFLEQKICLAGPLSDTARLDGGNNSTILNIRDADSVFMKRLVILNAGNDNYFKGAIYCNEASVDFSDLIMRNNDEDALIIENATVNIENSSISGNGNGCGLLFRDTCHFTANGVDICKNGNGVYADSAVVTLENLLINDNGTGIVIEGGDVECLNIISHHNSGSGISCSNAELLIRNCEFTENSSGGGGFSNTSGSVINSTWMNNHTPYYYIPGGGVYLSGSNLTFEDNIIENNQSKGDGGGLYMTNSAVILRGTSVRNNKADNCNGGGIYILGDTTNDPLIQDCSIDHNTANCGGGLFINGATPYLSNTDIYSNLANKGGGIYFGNSSADWDETNRCDILLNASLEAGYDLYAEMVRDLIPVVVDTFTVIHPTDIHAWQVENYDFDILNGAMEMGEYDIYVSPSGNDLNSGLSPEDPLKTIRTAYVKVTGDTVPPYKIYLAEGTYSVSQTGESFPVHLQDNMSIIGAGPDLTALHGEDKYQLLSLVGQQDISLESLALDHGHSNDRGGGIYSLNTANLDLKNVLIKHCFASKGAALYTKNSSCRMAAVDITSNEAGGYGGAWYAEGSTAALLTDVTISENKASNGGGLCCYGSTTEPASIQISGNQIRFEDNHITSGRGGAIYFYRTHFLLQNIILNENSGAHGGGIGFLNSSGSAHNLLMTGNSASGSGGGVYGIAANCDLFNCTFTGNTCDYAGSLYFTTGSNVSLKNCIFWGNENRKIKLSTTSMTVQNCDIEGGEAVIINSNGTVNWLEGNLDLDPWFLMSGDHPFQLSDDSPCIDAGIPDTTGLNLPLWDLMGNYRMWDGDGDGDTIVDMGAYEFGSVGVGVPGSGFRVPGSGFQVEVWPNPTSGVSSFGFRVSGSNEHVTLKIYDLYGQEVRALMGEAKSPGDYTMRVNVADLPAGVYLVRVQAGGQSAAKKLVVQ